MVLRNRIFKSIWGEFRHLWYGWPVWITIIMTFLLCMCTELPKTSISEPVTVLSAFILIPYEDMLQSNMLCAERVILRFMTGRWFPILLPVVAGFPSVYIFFDEWFGGGYYNAISRHGRTGYALSKSTSCALIGGTAVLLGCILYAVCVYLYFPHISDYPSAQIEQFYLSRTVDADNIFLEWGGLLWNVVAVTMVFALVDLIFVVVFREKFLALTTPMILQYLSERLTDFWNGRLWQLSRERGDLEIFNRFSALTMLLPSNQLSMYYTFPYHTHLPIGVYYLILLGIFCLLMYGFHRLLERRVIRYA